MSHQEFEPEVDDFGQPNKHAVAVNRRHRRKVEARNNLSSNHKSTLLQGITIGIGSWFFDLVGGWKGCLFVLGGGSIILFLLIMYIVGP